VGEHHLRPSTVPAPTSASGFTCPHGPADPFSCGAPGAGKVWVAKQTEWRRVRGTQNSLRLPRGRPPNITSVFYVIRVAAMFLDGMERSGLWNHRRCGANAPVEPCQASCQGRRRCRRLGGNERPSPPSAAIVRHGSGEAGRSPTPNKTKPAKWPPGAGAAGRPGRQAPLAMVSRYQCPKPLWRVYALRSRPSWSGMKRRNAATLETPARPECRNFGLCLTPPKASQSLWLGWSSWGVAP